MRVYLVMFSEDFEGDILDSIFAKKEDAELQLEVCIKEDNIGFNWSIKDGEVK